MGLQLAGMITPTSTPFNGIVPGKAAMPLGQISLSVTFGTPSKQGYPGQFVRASAYAELDGKRKRQSIYPGSGPRS